MAEAYVYRLFSVDDSLLYVGSTMDVGRRLAEHKTSKAWWPEVARYDIRRFDSASEAVQSEVKAIQGESPRHNLIQTRSEIAEVVEVDIAAARYAEARSEMTEAKDALRQAVVQEKATHGTEDAVLARRAGVDRMTILEWLGKRSRSRTR